MQCYLPDGFEDGVGVEPIWRMTAYDGDVLRLRHGHVEMEVRFWPYAYVKVVSAISYDKIAGPQKFVVDVLLNSDFYLNRPFGRVSEDTSQLELALFIPDPDPEVFHRRALNHAVSQVPTEILEYLIHFNLGSWELLELASRSQRVVDLISSNPALFFLWTKHFDLSRKENWPLLEEQLRQRQRHQLKRFGFPESSRWVHILRKIDPMIWHFVPWDDFQLFAQAEIPKHTLRYLCHCKQLGIEFLEHMLNPEMQGELEARLRAGRFSQRSLTILSYRSIIMQSRREDEYVPDDLVLPKRLDSLRELVHLVMVARETRVERENWCAEEPFPCPSGWKQLRTVNEVLEAGISQANCLVENRKWFEPDNYLYRVDVPEPAILHMARSCNGGFEIVESKGVKNRELRVDVLNSIIRTLESSIRLNKRLDVCQ